MRPERACECCAVVGTGRVHTACERGQRGLDISTLQKPSSFVMQPLSARLSCKLPSLISRGWRARKRAKPRPGRAPLAAPRPFRKKPQGPGLLHLDPSRRRTRFCLGFQGRGVLFDPRPGRRWWHRARRAPAGPGGRGVPGTRASCSQSQSGPVRGAPGPTTYGHLGVDPAQPPQDARKARRAERLGMGRSVASPQNCCVLDAPSPPSFCASASAQQLFNMTSISTISILFSFLLPSVKHIIFLLECKLALSYIKNRAGASIGKPSFRV